MTFPVCLRHSGRAKKKRLLAVFARYLAKAVAEDLTIAWLVVAKLGAMHMDMATMGLVLEGLA